MQIVKWFAGALVALSCLLVGTPAQAQDASTSGIFDKMPKAYKVKVVRPGEVRTTEYFFTTEITGNASATALASDKASHAGRFAGVALYCVAVDAALCQIPAITKNGTPITDAAVLRGGQKLIQPFNDILPLDTSDSIAIQANATITGAAGSNVSRVVYEFYTPRHFVDVAGANQ